MQKRILIVSQEISPYTEEGHIGQSVLDLAKIVTTKKKYIWKGLKTWKKDKGFEKNKNEKKITNPEHEMTFAGAHRTASGRQ